MRVSARTGRNTRVSGGPAFWLIVGPLIAMFYLMGWMLKGAVLIIAWCVREYSTHRQRTRLLKANTAAPIIKAPDLPADAEPKDAVPPGW